MGLAPRYPAAHPKSSLPFSYHSNLFSIILQILQITQSTDGALEIHRPQNESGITPGCRHKYCILPTVSMNASQKLILLTTLCTLKMVCILQATSCLHKHSHLNNLFSHIQYLHIHIIAMADVGLKYVH